MNAWGDVVTPEREIRYQRSVNERLKAELAQANDRIYQLESILGLLKDECSFIQHVLRLDKTAAKITNVLLKRHGVVSREALTEVIYGNRTDSDALDNPVNVLHTYFCAIRRALEKHDIKVKTVYKTGWLLEEPDREKLNKLLERAKNSGIDVTTANHRRKRHYSRERSYRKSCTMKPREIVTR